MSHTALTFAEHLAGIEAATDRLATWAEETGLDAGVPTCPGWTVRDLLAHEGMVHRWATRVVRGGDWRDTDDAAVAAQGRTTDDPVGWVRAGAADLLDALRAAPEDLEAFTFLRQAPPARLFWARRQDHETTIHALDALAAKEGRRPTAADAWFDAEHALDGIDELLIGFWQRRTKGPRAPQGKPYAALVVADSGERWLLDVSADGVETHHLAADEPGPDTATSVLSGTAVDLYLALWNRGGHVDDPALLIRRWQEGGAITW